MTSQEPIAIIGFSCRLPGGNSNPRKLWDFLERGGIASNKVPKNRFNIDAHWDGSHKPRTMRPLGGMFLEDHDPADFDASFFEISKTDAIAMDPNQRQMLEVVFEALENSGVPLEKLDGAPVGCFVGSFASDYGDMQGRDPDDRPANITVGVGRAILANRLSHFLNIKGPSMTIDTACSGSLAGLDVACRYLKTGEVDAAIIAASNLYLNPEHVMDIGAVGNAHSPTGLCHTFDISADGYVKAEAVSSIIIKRLSDAIRDGDPVRAVIRGSSTNSDGRTPGIASPSAEAQAVAIRAAYANAGITNLNDTAYLECHGTGTQAGDPTEVRGAASVFAASRPDDKPLIIGSIKSNLGHAEPAAGNSGLIKAVLAIENGRIPGNPTFENPSPKIDFAGWKVKASRYTIPWPTQDLRRASVNSFGYGGSNVHVVIEQAAIDHKPRHVSSYLSEDAELDFDDEPDQARPHTLVLSANDEASLRANIRALSNHLINPRVKVALSDLAHTLSERRSAFFHRAYLTTSTTDFDDGAFVLGKKQSEKPRIGLVFTGQGAQWPQMGKELLQFFPWTRSILEELDAVLQKLPDPPAWSLVDELTQARSAEHLRQPEFSQPLVTALQLCILAVLESWGVSPQSVIGHSSGEIAAAHAAGFLTRAGAIVAAFYRGRAAVNRKKDVAQNVGMLAVGLGGDAVKPYLEPHAGSAWVACYNSPGSVTVSGKVEALEALAQSLKADSHFARLLQVDLAYHSALMGVIGEEYENLLQANSFSSSEGNPSVSMFSSVTGKKKTDAADALYWKSNMVSPVQFSDAAQEMLTSPEAPTVLVEIGPSGALAGPISQIKKALEKQDSDVAYIAAWSRGANAGKALFDAAGRLFVAGHPVDLAKVNEYQQPSTIIDLPNYAWNHSIKYWHENSASRDWRFKKYTSHDLLGSKVLATSWQAPSWRAHLNLANVPWLKDHKMGADVLVPGSGFISMALEAIWQKHKAVEPAAAEVASINDLAYRFRNVKFEKALVLEEGKDTEVMLWLTQQPGSKSWHEFVISSTTADDFRIDHCSGLVRVQDEVPDSIPEGQDGELAHPTAGRLWYKAQSEIGYGFGPSFQKLKHVESLSGSRKGRAVVALEPPASKWDPQSYYPIHPASLDGCFQTVTPSLWSGERSSINAVVVPSVLDDLVINKVPRDLQDGLSLASSEYSGRGRLSEAKSYMSHCAVYDPRTGKLVARMTGLHFAELNTEVKVDPHTFDEISWKADISLLSDQQLSSQLLGLESVEAVNATIDLVAHKKPALSVLEISLDATDASSIWFDTVQESFSARSAYAEYTVATVGGPSLVDLQTRYEDKRNTSFLLLSETKENLGLEAASYDLIIVKLGEGNSGALLQAIEPLLSQSDAYKLVTQGKIFDSRAATSASESGSIPSAATRSPEVLETPRAPATADPSIQSSSVADTPLPGQDIAGIKGLDLDIALQEKFSAVPNKVFVAPELSTLGSPVEIASGESLVAHLYSPSIAQVETTRKLSIVSFSGKPSSVSDTLTASLESAGWAVASHGLPLTKPADGSIVLVLDELESPLLRDINLEQWTSLQALVSYGNPVLWITQGSQLTVTNPDSALAPGLFRVIRMEDQSAQLVTLDVESTTGPATEDAIKRVLDQLLQPRHKEFVETEFAERNGTIHVHRVVPDVAVNKFKSVQKLGAELVVQDLHANEVEVSLRAERMGTFDALTWAENSTSAVSVEEGRIEVEVVAAGVNFKDVAVTMGIVPENEYTLGYEAAGIVKRLGPGVTKFKVGDRVCFLANGSYANRLQVPYQRAHVFPDTISFEEAATIPSVYLASIYSLYHLGNLRAGQTVLIHSATGGVGISAIQLAVHKGAEVFVTAGTEEKREFLATNYGIPRDHIFSSRNTDFAAAIKKLTAGRGVDVILNSLTGEILDESWRITADGGIFVEIGKKDIVDRNSLSMEPFDRNCSFRAMDFSYTKDISLPLIEKLLGEIFELVNAGHVKPIQPITTFGFDDIPSALAHIRSGRHIGKVVISSGQHVPVEVPIRPAVRKLSLDPAASYLIVGGLKGLCGNLAIHMAKTGARRIIVCSRSGLADAASQKTVANCRAYGCEIVEAKGDVADETFVRKIFQEASPAISGVIQGAMILRDKPYEIMTHEEYHAAIHAKIQGTWALHRASLDQPKNLDFFTLLSSISGIVGKKGQSNYSAANTFLDSFAYYRQSVGLQANAVDLGLIEDVGYVAEQGGMDSHFDKRQWTPILEGTLRSILDYSILQQTGKPLNPTSAPQLVTGIGYPLPDDSDLKREARFGYLFSQAGGADGTAKDGGSKGDQAIRALKLMHASGATGAPLVKLATELVAAQITKILRLETELEPAKSLMAYGVDSLAAVELRNWVRSELGAELSTLDITNASSLIALCEKLVLKLPAA
ncbi:Beta-ketoacyl synthase [Cordyceps fumosorosea ARSEF 2679]|uniref:Beta-ketoacyl synthase n=1 Tax=Cordyceps fumosorosea (strain ARSEF 2679) TaxID=1081104 RepID=A0A167Q5M6_CORFA|nr:Beta-ketoacyl synthase [Cordyceps fumosorosea ARSEF 2679]OAA57318.1 Beta-ketoacyl synthase [Cordyceps fumosorosea ARSEF 2679]